MARNFFKTLKLLEQDAQEGSLHKGEGVVLGRLIAFVEAGTCTESQAEKFVMANFRLGGSEMAQLWNRMHPGSEKQAETFRGQISMASQYLCSLFRVSPDGLDAAFHGNSPKSLGYIADILEAYPRGGENLTGRFQALIHGGFLDAEAETQSVYGVSECAREIRFLKALDHDTIQSMLDSGDMDRLIYVWQSIREPLVTDTYVKQQGKSRKAKTPTVNRRKLEFSKAFASAVPKKPKPASGVVQEEPPIPLLPVLSPEFADVLLAGMKKYDALPEEVRQKAASRSTEESRQACRKVLELFTEEGYRACLEGLNVADLAAEFEKYRRG